MPSNIYNEIEKLKDYYLSLRWYERSLFPAKLAKDLSTANTPAAVICSDFLENIWWFQLKLYRGLQSFSDIIGDDFAQSLKELNQAGLLTGPDAEANFEVIAQCTCQLERARLLIQLHQAGLLVGDIAQVNRVKVINHYSPFLLSEIVKILNTISLFNRKDAQNYFLMAVRHENPVNLYDCLTLLVDTDLFDKKTSQVYFRYVAQHECSYDLTEILNRLVKAKLLHGKAGRLIFSSIIVNVPSDYSHLLMVGLELLEEAGLLRGKAATRNVLALAKHRELAAVIDDLNHLKQARQLTGETAQANFESALKGFARDRSQLQTTARLTPLIRPKWTNLPIVRDYYKQFTEEQWQIMDQKHVPILLDSGLMTNECITAFFEAIFKDARHSDYTESFEQIVERSLSLFRNIAEKQICPNSEKIYQWLGPSLSKHLDKKVRYDPEWLNSFYRMLASDNIRNALAGEISALNELQSHFPVLDALKGQDVRQLLLAKRLSFSEFVIIVHWISPKSHEALPDSIIKPLIRKHIVEYRDPLTPIPADDTNRQQLLQAALRKAAGTGSIWDLLGLMQAVLNINARGRLLGKTALHEAAIYACFTGDRLCFEVLLKHPSIDTSIKDNTGKTAQDYLTVSSPEDVPLQHAFHRVAH